MWQLDVFKYTSFLYKLNSFQGIILQFQNIILNKVVFMLLKSLIILCICGTNNVYVVKWDWEWFLIPISVRVIISTLITFNKITPFPPQLQPCVN